MYTVFKFSSLIVPLINRRYLRLNLPVQDETFWYHDMLEVGSIVTRNAEIPQIVAMVVIRNLQHKREKSYSDLT